MTVIKVPFECQPIKFYSYDEAYQCPESPGIYAWYLYRKLSKVDRERMIGTLQSLKNKGTLDPIEISSTKVFNRQWKGELNLEDLEPDEPTFPPHMSDSEAERISEKFNETFCGFFAPIYIGKSDNLQERILTHIGNLGKLEDNIALTDADIEDGDFARRAFRRGIKRSDLVFTVVCFENQARSLATRDVFEFYLNHISNPRLGRR